MAFRTPHTRQTSGASLLSSVHTGLNDSGHRLATEIIDDHWSSLSRDDVSMQSLVSARSPDEARSVAPSTSPASTTTHPQKHSRLPRAPRFRSCRGWSAELLSLITAFCILATIVVLLYHYNGKRLADTPSRPSLNTIVNILSTALTALVMLATTAVLGQSKWTRYKRSQPMGHLRLIDAASRGPRGALAVFFNPDLGIVVLAGAIIILSTIGIGPLLQETVRFNAIAVPELSRNATAPVTQFYSPNQTLGSTGPVNQPMQAAILGGLLSSGNIDNAVTFDCPTGNCTFTAPYSSLGICHVCAQQELVRNCDSHDHDYIDNPCEVTLPNGHRLAGEGMNSINVSTAYEPQIADIENVLPFLTVSIISLTDGPGPNCTNTDAQGECIDAIGAECDLFFCVKSYKASISENVVNEEMISVSSLPGYNASDHDPDSTTTYIPRPCFIEGTAYSLDQLSQTHDQSLNMVTVALGNQTSTTSPNQTTITVPDQCVFQVNIMTYDRLWEYMYENPGLFDGIGNTSTGKATGGYTPGNFGVAPLYNNGNASFGSIDTVFQTLALSMTNRVRQNGDPDNTTDALGLLLQTQIVVSVEWYWIILPVAVTLCSSLYLAAAVFLDAEDNIGESKTWKWKSDPLALLTLGLKSRTVASLDPLSSEKAMRKAAKQVKMQLVKTEGGWEFMEEVVSGAADEEEGLSDDAA